MVEGSFLTNVAEAMAVHCAIQVAFQQGYLELKVESNCNCMVDYLGAIMTFS